MDTLKITYVGQCGFLLDFGSVRIVTDPYLSDYVDNSFYSEATPWKRLYPAPVTLLELKPDGIIISHSHGDHMDPWTLSPYIDQGGQAVIVAPAPECGLLEEMNAPHIEYARAEKSFMIGDAKITPIPCAHTELHTDERGRFRELSYVIDCGGRRVFFGGDMSLYDGLVERMAQADCQVLLLPANGRDEGRTSCGIIGNTTHIEAANLAAALRTQVFIPMHHDLYAINGCSETDIRAAAEAAGANLRVMRPMDTLTLIGGPAQ